MSEAAKGTNAERISKVIFEYAAKIGRERDSDKLLVLISSLARDLVGADRCSIWLTDPEKDELWTKVAHGQNEIRIPAGHGLVGACVSSGEPVLVNNTAEDERFLGRVDKNTGYATQQVLVVPLHSTNDEVMGAFQALNKPGGFETGDIDLLQLAASYSASSIEEQRFRKEAEASRLLKQELEIASQVQEQLLPHHLPEIPGVEYASYCRPAKGVGGDYYDYFWLPGGNVGLTLGDVSGKGIAAAIMMASIQTSLRNLLLRGAPSLAILMDEFSQMVYESSLPSRYSTLFCAQLELEARRLTYVTAGQESPLVIRETDDDQPLIEKLNVGGMPIGLVPGARFEQESVILHPGDFMVCYSDGISEVANPEGVLWKEQVVEDLIWANRHESPKELIDIVLAAADKYADGADQHDDMTVAVLKML